MMKNHKKRTLKSALLVVMGLAVNATLSSAFAASLDDPVSQRGEEIYRTTCSNSFCHGPGGIAASAPRLAARGFDALYIAAVTANGVPDTQMVGFANALSSEDLNAVLTYVAGLNGITNPQFTPDNPLAGLGIEVANPKRIPLAGAEQEGREVFFDAYDKGLARCSTCHEVEGIGIPVAAPILNVPATVRALRNLDTAAVQTVHLGDEDMPAVILAQGISGTLFYDLTVVPPVMRTIPAEVPLSISEGSTWEHVDWIGAYSTAELEKVLAFLRAIRR
jgi:mono/diheme cytochrome c family protein